MLTIKDVINFIKYKAQEYHVELSYQDVQNLACLMQTYCYYLTGTALFDGDFIRTQHGPLNKQIQLMLQNGATSQDIYEFKHKFYLQKIAELIDLIFKAQFSIIDNIFIDRQELGTVYSNSDLLALFTQAFNLDQALTEQVTKNSSVDSGLDSSIDSSKLHNADDFVGAMQQAAITKEREQEKREQDKKFAKEKAKLAQNKVIQHATKSKHATKQDITDLLLMGTTFDPTDNLESEGEQEDAQESQDQDKQKQITNLHNNKDKLKELKSTDDDEFSILPSLSEEPKYKPKKKNNNSSSDSGASYQDLQDDSDSSSDSDSDSSSDSSTNNTDAGAFNAANGDSNGNGIPDYLEDDDIFDDF